MALTDTAIRKLRPTDKPFKLGDSAGLYLLIKPNGSKLWYMKYRIDGCNLPLALCCRRHRPMLHNLKEAPVPSGRFIPLAVQPSANTGSQNIAAEVQIHPLTAPVYQL
ncbi:Arm DNA-binding domain-containing protein [Siccibacter turicensis]|uniref:Arm DNA-binding domain-containing protein n=1 Tax=Siccibacter turicensis TaxID=357233 RepID=UPI002158F8C0|nr:Arm DNA-binding domain-containing protein [Siccibacter turicensis]